MSETLFGGTESDAGISTCTRYRYWLSRRWGSDPDGRTATFIMLNPSTAHASADDPTIRRCISFAKRENCTGLVVINLYAWRATKPADLWLANDHIGPENNQVITDALTIARDHRSPVIAAWGANARSDRVSEVLDLIDGIIPLSCLGVTKNGYPRHPLYVRGDQLLIDLPAAVFSRHLPRK